jgi:formylglycine-generating enzyme required for sulfatase activity
MIDMDRQKAFAVLGLPDDASSAEIDALVIDRRRKLRQRIVFASTVEQRQTSELALAELESAHVVATLAKADLDSNPPAGAAISLPMGMTLGDRYVIRRSIGYGESGAVFAALDLSWGKEVALKIIRPELLLVPGTYERLQAATQSVFELAHSGVVSVYGVTKMKGQVVIAMELLPQRNLRSFVANAPKGRNGLGRSGPAVGQVVDIVSGISAALDYARVKTLHLNLKPDNVIVTDEGFIKLTDFGLDSILGPALQITSPTAREQRRYRAPELARQSETGSSGRTAIDERADQFSVAAIAHFLLLAAAPYPDPSAFTLRHMGLPKPLADVLSRALSSDPHARFTTLKEFSAAFSRASRKRVSRRVITTTLGSFGIAALLTIGTSVVTGRDNPLAAFLMPLIHAIPGFAPDSSEYADVLALQDKVLTLSSELTRAQNTLRRSVIESRIEMRSKAQSLDLAESDEQLATAEVEYVAADRAYRSVSALSTVANPEIFNNPETLNAINLIGLANDHISQNRQDAARAALSRAEAVLLEKLQDFAQAEILVAERFSEPEQKSLSSGSALDAIQSDQLRRDWQSASQTRRRFAAEVQARMVTVPRGVFEMGDITGLGNKTEQPVRAVLVPAFQLSAFEVTIGEFESCVADGLCRTLDFVSTSDQSSDLPAMGINWFDAQDYITWLSRKTGAEYRLPTEAEWEYAARAQIGGAYPWGDQIGRGLANCINCGSAWERIGPAPVGSFAANAFGLNDMAGNVWEWTADCWYPNYDGAPAIATAREGNAICAERVMRGGSWDNDAWLARTTYRGRGRPDMRHDLYGFRVAKSVD